MSGRGRGRGGFGGRGGGRGGPPTGPVARDDDGTVLSSAPLGPPPVFPEIELPEHPEIEAKDALLLLRRNDLLTYAKTSPFFLEPPKQEKDGPDSNLDRYSDRGLPRTREREPLSAVVTLSTEFFPEEILPGDKRRGKVQQQQQLRMDAFWKSQGKKSEEGGGLHRLEQLAQLENNAGAPGAPGAAGATAGGDDDEPPVEDIPMDTDEEEDMEYDDYYQGEHFDDDDGYDDGYDDGGGDDGPTY